jgi:hypothetical protein
MGVQVAMSWGVENEVEVEVRVAMEWRLGWSRTSMMLIPGVTYTVWTRLCILVLTLSPLSHVSCGRAALSDTELLLSYEVLGQELPLWAYIGIGVCFLLFVLACSCCLCSCCGCCCFKGRSETVLHRSQIADKSVDAFHFYSSSFRSIFLYRVPFSSILSVLVCFN